MLSIYRFYNNKFFFQGALQDVKLVTKPHGYLVQCPDQNTGKILLVFSLTVKAASHDA